jgi:hypothetical protein
MSKKKPFLNGPESIPLRNYVKSFPMVVTVYDNDDNAIREEKINYGEFEHRKWLGRLTYWACDNGYVVQTERA